jgi:hypothetical protein
MASQFYKTTERQRTSAQTTRKRRVAAGKPQPVVVDEALSAALKALLRMIKSQGDRPTKTSDILNSILESAVQHLVEVRGLDRQQCFWALSSRLIKRRRYISS